jgi:two-component system response regulator DevR
MTHTAVPAHVHPFRPRPSAPAPVVRRSELAARREAAEQERHHLARDLPARHPAAHRESPRAEIRVAIIDDHALVRQGLRAMIDQQPGLRVVGEASSARSAAAMLDQARPDVILLDLRLTAGGECDGLALCGTMAQRYPDLRVLVLTSSADEWLILESIRQGAKGFLVKDVDLTELVRAIRAVHRGESAFDSRSAGVVVRWMHGSQHPEMTASAITAREREILALLARGLSNVAIGQRLYISAATVKFHVGNLMQKLGTRRRAEAVYAASKLGLI